MSVATKNPAPEPVREEPRPTTPAPPPQDGLYRLSIEQYERMARAGILSTEDRTELIEGLLVKKMTKGDRHIGTTKLIVREVGRLLPDGWHVAKEDPIWTARSEPEPDVTVLRGRIEDYFGRKPNPVDIGLVVEVADSSYDADRRKLPIYAEAGIPHYWIANLNADRIEAYSDPTGPDPTPEYRTRRDYPKGESIPLIVDGREVGRLPIADLLAPAPN